MATQSGWRHKTSLFEKKFVERTIGATSWRFYPTRVSRLFQLRDTIKTVTEACAVLFAKNTDDYGQTVEKVSSNEGVIERQSTEATTPELAKLRSSQKRAAVSEAVEALLGDSTKLQIGKLLADSLRDDFASDVTDAEVNEFVESLDLAQLVEFLMGFAEANAKVFGPVGEKMRSALQTKFKLLVGGAEKDGDPAPSTPAS